MPKRKKPKVVLDSVVVVSAFLTGGLAAAVIDQCREKARLYTAEDILQEIRRVLLEKDHIRSRYTYPDTDVALFVNRLREKSSIVKTLPDLHVIKRDPKDDIVIACAVAAKADYIVSRDRDLLDLKEYQGIKIVPPEEFIHYLRTL